MSDLEKVQVIRHATGARIADCRRALEAARGSVEGAVELIERRPDPGLLALFDASTWYTGPALIKRDVDDVEQRLGWRLPALYVELLLQKNGGVPVNTCFPTTEPNSWMDDHILITAIRGIGGKYGIDPVTEPTIHADWGYPPGLVFAHTPTAGHTVVMFDYAACGSQGEPRVVWVDVYGGTPSIIALADDFASFLSGLQPDHAFE